MNLRLNPNSLLLDNYARSAAINSKFIIWTCFAVLGFFLKSVWKSSIILKYEHKFKHNFWKKICSTSSIICYFARTIQKCLYYTEESVLLGTKPLVDSIRHFIRGPEWRIFRMSSLCLSYRSMTSRFPPFAFVELVSPYNKKNITRWLEDMNLMLEWQEQYLTRSRYCSCHSNIKFMKKIEAETDRT